MFFKKGVFLISIFFVLLALSCNNEPKEPESESVAIVNTPLISYSVVQSIPHDITLFTEGLLFHNGKLYESTGSPDDLPQTKSMIGITDIPTGKFEKKIEIDRNTYFGEGITFLKGKLFQLTYKGQVGFIYDEKTLKQLGKFTFRNIEGWSLTTDSIHLIMSDGTDTLTYLNPADQKPVKLLKVTENGMPLSHINELEYINGYIYANVWLTNYIVKIDPANGKVVGKLDLSPLSYEAKNKNPSADVLNGIAFDPTNNKIYVTGKMWTNIYEIQFPH